MAETRVLETLTNPFPTERQEIIKKAAHLILSSAGSRNRETRYRAAVLRTAASLESDARCAWLTYVTELGWKLLLDDLASVIEYLENEGKSADEKA